MDPNDGRKGKGASMQLGGIGTEHARSHHVTTCIHDHDHDRKQQGAMKMTASGSTANQGTQSNVQLSLAEIAQRLVDKGRSLFRGIWGTNEANGAGTPGDKTGQGQTMAQLSQAAPNGQATGAEVQAVVRQGAVPANPYFTAVPEGSLAAAATPLQKVRAKVRGIAGQLAGKLPKKFMPSRQTKDSFHAKPEREPKEDLKRRSRYKKDELEIDCILTDESYLLDSYDRKGSYSQLTTKK